MVVCAGELAEQLQAGTGVFGSPGSMDDELDNELDDAILLAAAEAAGDMATSVPHLNHGWNYQTDLCVFMQGSWQSSCRQAQACLAARVIGR